MRGKPDFLLRDHILPGITPAHAGKTATEGMAGDASRDHPRACGENLGTARVPPRGSGSPPRMRGKHRYIVHAIDTAGITPAHAGKTFRPSHCPRCPRDHPRACGENFSSTSASRPRGGITPAHAGKTALSQVQGPASWDHPRACGENTFDILFSAPPAGSPPRMRGKRSRNIVRVALCGITPAHAGKTLCLEAVDSVEQDHPRACGENRMRLERYM